MFATQEELDAAFARINHDESKVRALPLPDLLGGARNAREFEIFRKPELRKLYETFLYGAIPPPPDRMEVILREEKKGALGGKAIRRQLDLVCSMKDGRSATLPMLLYLPAGKKNVPCFFGLNFTGNADTTEEEGIPLPEIPELPGGEQLMIEPLKGNRPHRTGRWVFPEVIGRGFASATIWYDSIFPDSPVGFSRSILTFFMTQSQWDSPQRPCGAISAWSWGVERAVDALLQQPEIDRERIFIHGHSRLGKTSLWSCANDPRPAMAISSCSGCCGASLFRRNFGETLEWITTYFPHWFVPKIFSYVRRDEEIPLDQHMLLSLIAPRRVAVGSGTLDLHADPKGEFLSLRAASEAYRLYGKKGFSPDAEMPEPDQELIGDATSYHIRTGKHDITPSDWKIYMDFAEREFPAKR